MNIRIVTTLIVLLTLCITTRAQDFDADSIYYTPIPKVKSPEPVKKISPFAESPAQAGDTTLKKRFVDYFFNLQVGSLIGCDDCISEKEVTISASTVHGATIGEKFRIGGGIGFDSYYNWQTMPIFASASWDVLGTRNTNALFLQFNYGWSMPWRTEKTWEYGETGVNGGQMVHGMAGFRLKYYDMRISFTLGGKYQSVSTYFETPTWYYDNNGNLVEGRSSRTTIEESLRRFSMAVTIGWK